MPSTWWVAPFGNPRIKGHLHLPEAYRSLSRPSSPPRAKASAIRSCLLLYFFLALSYSCIFIQNTIIYRYITASLYTLLFSLVQYVKDLIHVAVQCWFMPIKALNQVIHHLITNSNLRHYYSSFLLWWRITDSNRWPSACKADALASWANPPYVFTS